MRKNNMLVAWFLILALLSSFSVVAAADVAYVNDHREAQVVYGTVKVDGTMEAVWDKAPWYKLENWKRVTVMQKDIKGTVEAQFKLLWDEEYLYVYANVKTQAVNSDHPDTWQRDSIEIFLDENYSQSETYENDDTQARINYKNFVTVGVGSKKLQDIKSVAVLNDDGYVIEAAFPMKSAGLKEGLKMGFDFQVNETGGNPYRTNIAGWNDKDEDKTNGHPNRWGTIKFVTKATVEKIIEPATGKTEDNEPAEDNVGMELPPDNGTIKVKIDGKYQTYPQPPVMINDRTLVPLRGIFETLGATVDWIDAEQKVTAKKGDISVSLVIGDTKAYVNGEERILDQPAELINDRTLVPVRFVSEAMGASVDWDDKTMTVIIVSALGSTDQWISGDLDTVYPVENFDIIKNPHKGYFIFNTTGFTGDYGTFPDRDWDIASSIYIRTSWGKINPSEDVYNWNVIDSALEYAASRNAKVSMGFMPVNINTYETVASGNSRNAESTPKWVFDAGAKYTLEGGGDIKCPVWDDPVYIDKLEKFVKALAERYDGNENILFIENRSYGNWGEWHLGKLDHSKECSEETWKKYMSMYDCFKETMIALPGGTNEQIKYAVQTHSYSLKLDGALNPTHLVLFDRASQAKGEAMFTGEWFGVNWTYKKQIENGIWDKSFLEYTITETGLSNLAIEGKEFSEGARDEIYRTANLLGYWFKPVKISYTKNLGNGEKGKIAFRVKNDGVAPIYPNRSNTAYVKLALLDSNNEVLDYVTLDGINPHTWLPGIYTTESAEFEFDKYANAAKLAIGVFTNDGYIDPDVKLGIKDENINNWYILSNMSSEPDEVISKNKIYAASSTGSSKDYGYFRSSYAFDDDESTKWRSNEKSVAKINSWLEVDLGEPMAFSKVNIKEDGANIAGYKLQYELNGEWVDISEGKTIGSGDISFNTVKAQKVRLHVNKAKDQVSISEFKIIR